MYKLIDLIDVRWRKLQIKEIYSKFKSVFIATFNELGMCHKTTILQWG